MKKIEEKIFSEEISDDVIGKKVNLLSEVISQIIDEKIERMTQEDINRIVGGLKSEVSNVITKQLYIILNDMIEACKEVLQKHSV